MPDETPENPTHEAPTVLSEATADVEDGGEPEAKNEKKSEESPEAQAAKWKAMSRKWEAQAKANSDAAERLKELENAGKSETEKLQARLDQVEAEKRVKTIEALKLKVASEKQLPAALAKFLPDLDDEVDMISAADDLLEATGSTDTGGQPTRRPKSDLTNPLKDDEASSQREQVLSSMLGKSAL